MPYRKLTFPKDFDTLTALVVDAFQYPENPEWSIQEDEAENITEAVENLRRIWPIFNILGVFAPKLKELLDGFIWEEDGEPAGLFMAQRRGQSDTWFITTVAVNPQFRRRGIARKLVEAGLETFRQRGGQIALLDVISGNLPAYSLYESLGFEHFSQQFDLEYQPSGPVPAPEMPAGYATRPSGMMDWQPRYELEQRIAPENTQRYEPVEESRFRQPGYMRVVYPILLRAQNTKEQVRLILDEGSKEGDGQVVGYTRLSRVLKGRGRHGISIRLDPAHDHLAPWALGSSLHYLTAGGGENKIEMACPGWQSAVLETAKAAGFEPRIEFHRMGLVL